MRGWIQRLEHAARGDLASFQLLDGSRYYFEPLEVHKTLFLHTYYLQLGQSLEPPEILSKMCEARDPAAVLAQFAPENESAFVNLADVYDLDALISERRLVPIPHEPAEDLSE